MRNPRYDMSTYFTDSPLASCFLPTEDDLNVFMVLNHAGCSSNKKNCIGYREGINGSVDAQCELFRILDPWPIAVGNCGTVLNLSPFASHRSYPTRCSVSLSNDGYRYISTDIDAPCQGIARLIGLAWIPRADNDTEVDHIDGCKTHDVLSNLRWVSHAENMRNATYSPRRRWEEDDRVLCIPVRGQGNPICVHPEQVASIVCSSNISHVLTRNTRHSCNRWCLLLNPTISNVHDICNRYSVPHLVQPSLAAISENADNGGADHG